MTENIYSEVELIDVQSYIKSQEDLAQDCKSCDKNDPDEVCGNTVYSDIGSNAAAASRDSCYIEMTASRPGVNTSRLRQRKSSGEKIAKNMKCLWLCFLLVLFMSIAASLVAVAAAGLFVNLYLNDVETHRSLSKVSSNLESVTEATKAFSSRLELVEKSLVYLNSTLTDQLPADLQGYFASLNETDVSMLSRLTNIESGLASLNFTFSNQLEPIAFDCSQIYSLSPYSPSGYYNIELANGSSVRMFCNMTFSCGGIRGGWRKIANFDIGHSNRSCPDGLLLRNDSGIRTCGIGSPVTGCASVIFPTYAVSYSKVCGRVQAYQVGSVDAFGSKNSSLDDNYVDGISLTHGGFMKSHIWTFVAAPSQTVFNMLSNTCKCMRPNSTGIREPPVFVGQDYFCDSGSVGRVNRQKFYEADPLWDGAGCSNSSSCCSFNKPPWFFKQLPSPTSDDIELRVCTDERRMNEDVALSQVEIYVQ